MVRTTARAWRWRLLATLLPLLVVAGLGVALHRSQANGRADITKRWQARAALAGRFVSTYLGQLMSNEEQVATNTLSSADPSSALNTTVAAFGFQSGYVVDQQGKPLAVSLAQQGRVLTVSPKLFAAAKPTASQLALLAGALRGIPQVSNVESITASYVVVATAVPFATPSGQRVFAGAYSIDNTPLSAFLSDITTLKGAQVYLTDANSKVLASDTSAADGVALAMANPGLAAAAAKTAHATYSTPAGSYSFARSSVTGAPWSVALTVPSAELYATARGTGHWAPWVLVGALAVLGLFAGWLAVRLIEGRRRITESNESLQEIARTDVLTGLYTRRYLTEQLTGLLSDAEHDGRPVSVLMMDIDHFKQLNDTFGHEAGDKALRHVAGLLAGSLRGDDIIGRWGGEEFVAVLPHAPLARASVVADRMRELLGSTPVEVGQQRELVAIHISVGVAEYAGDTLEAFIARADRALYQAKRAGRNITRSNST